MERECAAFTYRAGTFADGFFRHLELEDILNRPSSDHSLTWIDMTIKDVEATRRILLKEFNFHPLAVDDALSREERPSLHQHESGFFLELAVMDGKTENAKFADVGVFVQGSIIVTVCAEPAPMLRHWFGKWSDRPAEVGPDAPTLLHSVLDNVVDGYFPIIDCVQDQIEDLEDAIYEGRSFKVSDALQIKRQLLVLRRQLAPLRDILNGLLRRDVGFITPAVLPYYQDIYDHSLRVLENLDLGRDILTSIMDAQLNVASNRLNEVMRVMTIIATVLMSMALVAGIYGMNFSVMPELNWPMGYAFALVLMLGIGAFEVWLFRRKGWL